MSAVSGLQLNRIRVALKSAIIDNTCVPPAGGPLLAKKDL
jgi:hypothetical protein